jgi:snRNA-activating protein complex subunit 3
MSYLPISFSTDEKFEKLMESIDLDNKLRSDADIRIQSFDQCAPIPSRRPKVPHIPKPALKLKCMRELLDRQKNTDPKRSMRLTKYNKHRYFKQPVDTCPPDLQCNEEILLSIRIYEPFNYTVETSIAHHPRFQQEFFVLGSQYLTELRDKLFCQSNYGPFYDISELPDFDREVPAKTDSSGFFFIQNTFYNDTRNLENHDYSQNICKWAAKQPEIKELHTEKMETTKFLDLKFNAGYPMVYLHQGNCEHLFTVSDVRMLASSDSLMRSNYPIMNSLSSSRSTFCNICAFIEAKFLITESTCHMQDPTYLCEECFKSFHYVDGKKVGKFKAYYFYGNLITQ